MTTPTLPQTEQAARTALAAGDIEKAESLARSLLATGNAPLTVWTILVAALRRLGRHGEALAILERLVAAVPQNYELHFDLAEMYLLMGDFERGWREYRFRYHLRHTKPLNRVVQRPRWEGQPIPGKTLLIYDEQGFGDTFQFIRMVHWAKEKSGARIVLQIVREQKAFVERMQVADAIVTRGELPPAFDYHCQMMDLPMAMGITLSDLPGKPMPYLAADPERVEWWRKRLEGLPRPIVALNWAGRPEHFNDANRSTSLATFAPLADCPGSFVAIQKGAKSSEAGHPPAGMKLTDLSTEIADFEDTAAILTTADLLISIDSSPVHLAGALGRPAWVLLPFFPDWRWLLERSDTPWYPSVRLFRQPARGDWPAVMQAVKTALNRNAPGARDSANET
jgi:tetratricopeptide (TPR) repeat protein